MMRGVGKLTVSKDGSEIAGMKTEVGLTLVPQGFASLCPSLGQK